MVFKVFKDQISHTTLHGIQHNFSVNRNRWILSSLRPSTHAHWLARLGRLSVNVWRPEFDDYVLKTGGSSEAVLSWEGSNNVALHFSCSTTSLVLLVFGRQSSNSGLHTCTFTLRCPCLLPASGCGQTGVTTQYSSIDPLHVASYFEHFHIRPFGCCHVRGQKCIAVIERKALFSLSKGTHLAALLLLLL